MKSPVVHDRCIVIRIKINDEKLSTFSKASSDLQSVATTK